MSSVVYRSMCAWCSGGTGWPKSVGSTPLIIGAVCVCVPVTASRSRRMPSGCSRRAISDTRASETPVVSTAISTAGPSASLPIASARAWIGTVTPSDSVRREPKPLKRIG